MNEETVDRLTRTLRIVQRRRGHRAATDDTLLAWSAARARPDARRALDLGTGKGAAALLLLARLPACRVVGIEAVAASQRLAVRNAALNGLADRYDPRLGDLRDPAILDGEPPFDLVTAAPPFMPLGSGVVPKEETRAAGRFELRGGVREFAAAAARALAPGGAAVVLMDGLERSAGRALAAFAEVGLHPRRVLLVRPHPGRAPTYRIFTAARAAGPCAEATLCLRPAAVSGFSCDYEEIRREMDLPRPGRGSRRDEPNTGSPANVYTRGGGEP
jgi:tRNA1(Val) A37 N6-methylase TrmN6